MDPSEAERLWAELTALRLRVEQLEEERPEPGTAQSAVSSSGPEPGRRSRSAQQAAEPASSPSFTQPLRPTLESRIGSQWFNRVGIVALLVGAAWFLKYAVDERWLGPAARIGVGIAAGLGLIAWSERFRRRRYPVFSFSLKAVGTGLLYLSLWAAFALFHLIDYPAAFAAMALVTATNAWMCWVQRSEVLAAFAAVGGFLTPSLLAAPMATPVWVLGSYLLLLNAGLFTLLVLRQWPRLLPAAFLGTVGYLVELARGGGRAHAPHGAAFAVDALFFLLFAVAPLFTSRLGGVAARPTAVFVTLGNAVAACFTLWLLPGGGASGDWASAVLACCYWVLLLAPPLLSASRPAAVLAASHAGLAIALTACAFYSDLHGGAIVLGLAVETALLLPVTLREDLFDADAVLRSPVPAACLLGAASGTLFFFSRFASDWRLQAPVWNVRSGLYVLLAAMCAAAVRIAAKHHALAHRRGEMPRQWAAMGKASAVLASLLLLTGGVLEIRASADAPFYTSAWAAGLGACLLVAGFRVRWAFLRWLALGLLTLAIAKVFLFDTRSLSQGYRILSFLGLGVLLLLVSFIYQRDLLHLRGEEHEG